MRMLERMARTNKKDMPSGYLEDASEVSNSTLRNMSINFMFHSVWEVWWPNGLQCNGLG